MRRICVPLVKELKALPGIQQVTLTTNGILLKEQLPGLMEAGLDAVNISLDTLDAETFRKITRRDELKKVLEGLEAALSYPELKVKVNCVPTFQSQQDLFLLQVAVLAKENPLHVRFIEMMPIGLGKEFTARDEETVKGLLERAYGPTPEETFEMDPAIIIIPLKISRAELDLSVLCPTSSAVSATVCALLTGYLKGCLQFENGADLKALLRGGVSDALLKETIQKTIYEKPAGHNFQEKKNGTEESHIMAQIDG